MAKSDEETRALIKLQAALFSLARMVPVNKVVLEEVDHLFLEQARGGNEERCLMVLIVMQSIYDDYTKARLSTATDIPTTITSWKREHYDLYMRMRTLVRELPDQHNSKPALIGVRRWMLLKLLELFHGEYGIVASETFEAFCEYFHTNSGYCAQEAERQAQVEIQNSALSIIAEHVKSFIKLDVWRWVFLDRCPAELARRMIQARVLDLSREDLLSVAYHDQMLREVDLTETSQAGREIFATVAENSPNSAEQWLIFRPG